MKDCSLTYYIILSIILIAAFEGAEVVFHMAAPDSSINNYQLHYSVNVQGKVLIWENNKNGELLMYFSLGPSVDLFNFIPAVVSSISILTMTLQEQRM